MTRKSHGPNTPLWLDLALGAGFVALVYGVDRAVLGAPPRPWRRGPNGSGAQASHDQTSLAYRSHDWDADDDEVATDRINGDGAMARRPSQEPEHLQHARSRERDRGRRARSPAHIPARGWGDILYRVYNQIGDDRLLAVAAGAVFYMLLALFPAVTALVSLYGLFTDASVINEHLSLLAGVMPPGALDIIREQVTRLTGTSTNALSFGFFFGLGLALWSANAGMKAIIDALNVVYDESEKRGFVKLTLVAFAFTLGGLVFILLALSAIVVLPLVLAWTGFETLGAQILSWLRWPALLVVIMLFLAVLYRYGPSRTRAQWRWLSVGSIVATVTWLAASALFSWYLANFANYDATYGSLGAGIGLMMWLWLSVIVILVGGELNAEIEHQTAHDTTVGGNKPLGARGATMADTVGDAWR